MLLNQFRAAGVHPGCSGGLKLHGASGRGPVAELIRLAGRPTTAEVLAQIGTLAGGRVGLSTAVADLRTERPAS